MAKIFLFFGIVLALIILLGANIRGQKEAPGFAADPTPCRGYTIIEFGKGINCRGDTVKLVKIAGGGQALEQATMSQ